MNAPKKFRKSANSADEMKTLFEFLREEKIPISFWQEDGSGKKKIKVGLVHFVNNLQKKIKFVPLPNVAFNFHRELPIYFFTTYKSVFGQSPIWDIDENYITINFPTGDSVRLSEDRGQSRVRTFLKQIVVSFWKKEKKFTFKLEDFSLGGMGIQISTKDQWHFDTGDVLEIESIGTKIFNPPLSFKILHISIVTNVNANAKDTTSSIVKFGGQFQVTFSERDFIEVVTEFT